MPRYRRKKIENEVERRLAIGLIVSGRVLKEMGAIWDPDLIEVPYVRQIAEWCFDYFRHYGKPPGKHIQDIFRSKERKGMDEDLAGLIEDFLSEISDEHERADKFNVSYLLDEAEERFRSRALTNLSEDIQAELSNGSVDGAEALLANYKRIARPSSTGSNPWEDADGIYDAFEHHVKPLFAFPGAFGRLVNDHLVRSGLIGIMGRMKIGKTWNLMEFTYRAARARCNVAFIQVGDMTQEEMILRLHTRHAGRSHLHRYCREMVVPVLDCFRNQQDTCKWKHRESPCGLQDAEGPDDVPKGYLPCTYCMKHRPHAFRGATFYRREPAVEPLTWREALKSGKQFMGRLRGRNFKLVSFPNSSVNVENIRSLLEKWQVFEGFVPDVIVIDYADILAPEPDVRRKETRDQQNATWRALRRLAQEKHSLVITATQSDAASYDVRNLRLKHFSEDRRKYDHVTGMLGLNQTEEEKELGHMRIGWLLLRQGEYDPNERVIVLQCLQRGQPHIGSYRVPKKRKKKEEE